MTPGIFPWPPESAAASQGRARVVGPVTPEVREELERLRRERPGVGEALMLLAPNDIARPVTVQIASDWLRHAEKLAELEPPEVARGTPSGVGGQPSGSTSAPRTLRPLAGG